MGFPARWSFHSACKSRMPDKSFFRVERNLPHYFRNGATGISTPCEPTGYRSHCFVVGRFGTQLALEARCDRWTCWQRPRLSDPPCGCVNTLQHSGQFTQFRACPPFPPHCNGRFAGKFESHGTGDSRTQATANWLSLMSLRIRPKPLLDQIPEKP